MIVSQYDTIQGVGGKCVKNFLPNVLNMHQLFFSLKIILNFLIHIYYIKKLSKDNNRFITDLRQLHYNKPACMTR